MVTESKTNSVSISNITEFALTPSSEKLDFPADIYIGRAGKNLRFRKLRSLIELGEHMVEIGIVPSDELPSSPTAGSEPGMPMRQAIDRLKEIVEERVTAGILRLTLIVDVSCLPRGEQGVFFAALGELARRIEIRLGVGYSLSRYSPPPQKWARSITPVAPVHASFAGWGDPLLPIHIIVGLGYESGKAFGAVQYLEPAQCTPLIPRSPEERFLNAVKGQNRDFLKRHPHPLLYEVMQPARTYLSLVSLLSGILRDHRAILLPFGPKILFSLSLLVGLTYPEASVWYVEGEDYHQSDEGAPSGHASLFICTLAVRTETD